MPGGLEDVEGLESMERAAREIVGKVMANENVQNFADSIRSGALKVRPFLCCGLLVYFGGIAYSSFLQLGTVIGLPCRYELDSPPFSLFSISFFCLFSLSFFQF